MTTLWWVDPRRWVASPQALALLTPEERAQHLRFIPPKKRHEYLLTRVLVRTILGRELGIPPGDVQFIHNEWGRPALPPPAHLYFNLTHTDDLVMCFVSADYEVGVDTELASRAQTIIGLAPRVFAPKEREDLAALPEAEQAHRAVALWTLKESYIKARGMGLALALDGFAFRFDGKTIRVEVEPALQDDGAQWQFETWLMGPHVVSTAIRHPAHERVNIEVKEITLGEG